MSEFVPMTKGEIEQLALDKGCRAILAAEDELQFDLDTESARNQFTTFVVNNLTGSYGSLQQETWPSKSGNLHAVVKLPWPMTIPERIALQVMGGSDIRREYAALRCFQDGSETPLVLFKPLLLLEATDASKQV